MSGADRDNKVACKGPGYPSPMWAFKNGPREKILYVITVQPDLNDDKGDYLSTVDVDPDSPTYCQIIHRTYSNRKGDEFHHMGWNTCSSCFKKPCCDTKRDKLVLPCLKSDAVYVIDVAGERARKPEIFKFIDGSVLRDNDVSAPHTSHCLANGNIMISTMGDKNEEAKGDFILFDKDFNCIGTWTKGDKKAICGYDYWYQPHFNIMVASEWSSPKLFRRGFHPSDIEGDNYGRRINFYDWKEQKLIDTVSLGEDGIAPLEIRFMHNPKRNEGFVGCCLNANVFRFYKKNESDEKYSVDKVIDIPGKKVEGWVLPEMQGMMSDILSSLDDKYLYFSNWLHGDVRQYDITDPGNPKLTGQVFIGGKLLDDSPIKVLEDRELKERPKPVFIKGRRLVGGPQMLQLSLDGTRLYVSSSLFSPWDKQFYPHS